MTRGFSELPCPKCGEQDAITVNLYDVEDLHCSECDTDFSLQEIRELLAAWGPVVKWLDTAPVREDPE